jgi:hypothetical protein
MRASIIVLLLLTSAAQCPLWVISGRTIAGQNASMTPALVGTFSSRTFPAETRL